MWVQVEIVLAPCVPQREEATVVGTPSRQGRFVQPAALSFGGGKASFQGAPAGLGSAGQCFPTAKMESIRNKPA